MERLITRGATEVIWYTHKKNWNNDDQNYFKTEYGIKEIENGLILTSKEGKPNSGATFGAGDDKHIVLLWKYFKMDVFFNVSSKKDREHDE